MNDATSASAHTAAPATPAAASAPSTVKRLLPAEEWPRLFELFADSFPDQQIPLPPTAACAVIEVDGEIVAATFFTIVYHMEPAMARPGYGRELWDLARFIEERLVETLPEGGSLDYYVTAPNSPHFIEREKGMGREPLMGHVPVLKTLTKRS